MFLSTLPKLLQIRAIQIAKYSTKLPERLVAFKENQDMIVCWHPEPEYPYECTRPLPVQEVKKCNSVLKVGDKEITEAFRKTHPQFVVERLAAMTYTTKHIWFPRSRDKRAKKNPMDRPYL